MSRALKLWRAGFRAQVSVIPPGARLSPTSTIPSDQLGKCPGVKYANGLWGGYGWLRHNTTEEDAKQWVQDGSNIGLLGAAFPGVDIDCTNEGLAKNISAIVQHALGWAPERVGNPPKRLLMYRTGEPFSRMAIIIKSPDGKETHLVEVLGDGRQYVIEGVHPLGRRYTWNWDLLELDPDEDLKWVTREQVSTMLDALADRLRSEGWIVERVGDGTGKDRDPADAATLAAPSIGALREVVDAIPNTNDLFPERDDYIRMGYAIKAASGDDEECGYELFASWAARWDGGTNEPERVRSDWRRMHPPYSIGWGWLTEYAKKCGDVNVATYDFEATSVIEEVREREEYVAELSDEGIVDFVIRDVGDVLRYVADTGRWYTWDGHVWRHDTGAHGPIRIRRALRRLAAIVTQRGATEKELKESARIAMRLGSYPLLSYVTKILKQSILVTTLDAFDPDPWVLNTPAGIVDLKTGAILPTDPGSMCSQITTVAPDFEMETVQWDKFLRETTAGDVELQMYLQRLIGYGVTGLTSEQMFPFLYGSGGNGKSTFVNAVAEIMGTYARTAAMDTFTAGKYDSHPADLAALAGARIVTAQETQRGRRWDEARIKMLTSGDAITARFMRQDFFTYIARFLLLLNGNQMPSIENVDDAMRRRVHLVPFVNKPPTIDKFLPEKLRDEYPGILAWIIRGCLMWQKLEGLAPPKSVCDETAEYFEEEDVVGRWLEECCVVGSDLVTPTRDLFKSWEQWANANREYVGKMRGLVMALKKRGGFFSTRKYIDGVLTRCVEGLGLKPVDVDAHLGKERWQG